MRNSGFEEFFSLRREPEAPVERHCPDLCTENGAFVSRLARQVQQRLEQCTANAFVPPGCQHGHPADMPVGKQPSGANCLGFCLGKQVPAYAIEFVPLQFQRNRLLAHEYLFANGAKSGLVGLPIGQPDAECI